MKILALDLKAFGPFTDVTLDLSRGREGLHLIHGPNEAGKSSSLRALSDFLFGVPVQSKDNFLHKNEAIRIGATLRDRDGHEVTLVRRKGRAKTLVDASGRDVDENVLAKIIGPLGREGFERQYRIDHAQLVLGGKAMSDGKGDFGQMLFAAGSGLAGLRGVLSTLDEEMGSIFKFKGQNQTMNQALAELKQARDDCATRSLPTKAWEEENDRRKAIEAELKSIDARFRKLDAEKRRLERIEQTLTTVARRGDTKRRLDELASVKILPNDFAQRRLKAQTDRVTAERRRDDAKLEIETVAKELLLVAQPEPLLDHAESVRRIQEEKGGYLKALREIPNLRQTLAVREEDARSLLAELRPGLALDEAESLRPTAQVKKTLRELENEHTKLAAARDNAEADARALDDGSNRPAAEAKRLLDELTEARKRWQGLGAIDGGVVRATSDLKAATEKAAAALKRLPLWSGTLEGLESSPTPSAETVERFEREHSEAGQKLANGLKEVETARADLARIEAEIEGSRLSGEVPTEADLLQSRSARDELWGQIRDALEANGKARPADLPASYEPLVQQADTLADRLRREADRVAAEAQRRALREAFSRKLDTLQADRAQAEAVRSRVDAAWLELWRPLGIEPGPPREMRAWLAKRDDLIRQADEVRSLRSELHMIDQQRAAALGEASAWLERLGAGPAGASESLASLLSRAQVEGDRLDRSVRFAEAKARLDSARAKLEDWHARWRAAVATVGLDGSITPAVALEILDRTETFFAKLKEVRATRAQIDKLRNEIDTYERGVREVAEPHGFDVGHRSVEQLATEIANRLRQGEIDADRRDGLVEQKEKAQPRLDSARSSIGDADDRLALLKRDAGTDDFAAAEAASEEKKALRQKLQEIDDGLLTLGGGLPLEQLVLEAELADRDALPDRIADLAAEIAPLEALKSEKNIALGESRERLARMDGGASAADAEEQAQLALGRIGTEAEKYIRLRLGSAVLRKAIERYREKNARPVLQRAAKLFSGLTIGSFVDLTLDESDKGELLLRGVKSDGRTVEPDRMSEGTADALYLALRLAGLHSEFDRQDPVPFVVDDILVNLDNRRTVAALEALAELSKRTQVLLFTHHEHLVGLARERLDEGQTLFVHELPDPMPASNPADLPLLEGSKRG